jgi:hypothetical protein
MHQDDSIHDTPVYEHAVHDRRASDRGLGGKVLSIEDRLERDDKRMDTIEVSLAANTKATNEVLEIVLMGKSFFKVLGWIGKGIKIAAGIAAPCIAAYAAWKHSGGNP